jgi:hypothetical protein
MRASTLLVVVTFAVCAMGTTRAQEVNGFNVDKSRAPTPLTSIAFGGVTNTTVKFIVYNNPIIDGQLPFGAYDPYAFRRCPEMRAFTCGVETSAPQRCSVTQDTEVPQWLVYPGGAPYASAIRRPKFGIFTNFPVNIGTATATGSGAFTTDSTSTPVPGSALVPKPNYMICELTVTTANNFVGNNIMVVFDAQPVALTDPSAQLLVVPVATS